VLIFAVNFLFVHFLALRLMRLTAGVEAIAAGRLDTELVYSNPSESDDELDHVYHAVNLLKRSLIVLFRRLNRQHWKH
jgi:methyl-accepting chemotaxis protein